MSLAYVYEEMMYKARYEGTGCIDTSYELRDHLVGENRIEIGIQIELAVEKLKNSKIGM